MEQHLISYWITFPNIPHAPIGIGVTAFSEEDAFRLIEESGYGEYMQSDFVVTDNIKIWDLHSGCVVPFMGPITFRGVWFPCCNIGFGASGQTKNKI
jgi:hypothetical protein